MVLQIRRTVSSGPPTGLAEGQLAVEMNNANLWVGVPTSVDPSGVKLIGAQGPDGAPGAQWLQGTAAPAAGVGVVGDWFINTTNSQTYEKTAAATWTTRANLRGLQGVQGNPGNPGPQGPTGPQGPQGLPGIAAPGDAVTLQYFNQRVPDNDLPQITRIRVRNGIWWFWLDRPAPANCYLQPWRASQTPWRNGRSNSYWPNNQHQSWNFRATHFGSLQGINIPQVYIPPNTVGPWQIPQTGSYGQPQYMQAYWWWWFRPPTLTTSWRRGNVSTAYYREGATGWPTHESLGMFPPGPPRGPGKRRSMFCTWKFGTMVAHPSAFNVVRLGRMSEATVTIYRMKRTDGWWGLGMRWT